MPKVMNMLMIEMRVDDRLLSPREGSTAPRLQTLSNSEMTFLENESKILIWVDVNRTSTGATSTFNSSRSSRLST